MYAPATPRSRADAALEAVGDHPGAASDVALVHRTVRRRVERRSRVLGADVEPVHLVENAVPSLGDYRQAPGAAVTCQRGRHERFVDGADGMRVGQRDRRRQQPRLLHPLEARDFAVAVQPERRRIGRELRRDDDRDAGPPRRRLRRASYARRGRRRRR